MNKNEEVYVHFGKQDDEECHVYIKGVLDKEFLEDLTQLMLEHNYTESL